MNSTDMLDNRELTKRIIALEATVRHLEARLAQAEKPVAPLTRSQLDDIGQTMIPMPDNDEQLERHITEILENAGGWLTSGEIAEQLKLRVDVEGVDCGYGNHYDRMMDVLHEMKRRGELHRVYQASSLVTGSYHLVEVEA